MPAAVKKGKGHKGHRSAVKKGYYAAYGHKLDIKKIRARGKRQERIAAARDYPHIGSPSQLRTRAKRARRVAATLESL